MQVSAPRSMVAGPLVPRMASIYHAAGSLISKTDRFHGSHTPCNVHRSSTKTSLSLPPFSTSTVSPPSESSTHQCNDVKNPILHQFHQKQRVSLPSESSLHQCNDVKILILHQNLNKNKSVFPTDTNKSVFPTDTKESARCDRYRS